MREHLRVGGVIAVFFGLSLAGGASAQPRPRLFSAGQGLPLNEVNCLALDGAGALWGGTRIGPFRYDGQRFATFDARAGLPTTLIQSLTLAPDGTAWLGYGDESIVAWRAGRGRVLTRFAGQTGFARGLWASARPDGGTRLWVLSGRNEALLLDLGPRDTTLTRFPVVGWGLAADARLTRLVPGPGGQLWVASEGGTVVVNAATGRPLPPTGQLPAVLRQGQVFDVQTLADTVALVATESGLWRVARAGAGRPWRARLLGPAQGLPAGVEAGAVALDRAGRCWVETGRGLYLARPGQPFVLADSTVVAGQVALLLPDAEGNLWRRLLTGLAQFAADERFQRVGLAQGQPLSNVAALAFAPHQKLYVGSSAGLACYPTAGATRPAPLIPLPPEWQMGAIANLLPDHRGGLWAAAFLEGVARLDLATGRWWVPPWSSRGGSYAGFAEDARGRIWLNGPGEPGGALCYDPATDRARVHSFRRRPGDYLYGRCYYRDRRGRIWVSGGQGGLFYVDEKADSLRPAPGLPPTGPAPRTVQALADDAAGNLWLAIEGEGVRRYDGHRLWPALPAASGVAPLSVAVGPADGLVWLGTYRGLDCLDPRTGQRRHFGRAEGFTDANCIQGASRFDAQGRLWVGTADGLYVLDPARAHPDRRPPVLELSGLRVGLRDTAFVPGLHLAHDQNQLTLRYVGVSLSNPALVRYRTRLVGLQTDWQPLTAQGEATFTSLPPGAYRFEVRAANADGVWTAAPLTYAFAIRPAWWNTWWFRSLLALAGAGLLYALYRVRLAQVLAVERLRLGIARDLHDDVGSTLSSISILSQLAEQQQHPDQPASPLLSQIGSNARQTLAAMDDIVWAINPHHDLPQDLTARLRHHAAELLEAQGLALAFDAGAPPTGLRLAMQTRREVFLIFKELLNNTLKYAQARTVRVSLAFGPHQLRLTVADDGRGFDPAAPAQGGGHGLPNTQARAALLGGKLALDTAPGRGTQWQLTVPV